jgi:hypothetical protein
VRLLLVTDNVVPSTPIPVILIMEALSSYEISILISVTSQKKAFSVIDVFVG